MALPSLRPLDFFPVRIEGQDLVAVRDPEGMVEEGVVLPPQVYLVAMLLDGRRDVIDVQAEYVRHSGGSLLLSADLRHVVEELDALGLLQTETLEARRRARVRAFRSSPVRPAEHAGKSYPEDPSALRSSLDSYLDGVPDGELGGPAPHGVVAPHIDFTRGGWCYGWAYAALRASLASTFVVLGVAHAASPVPFVLTEKPFETPLGTVPVDRDFSRALQQRAGDLTAHEIAHRMEHSLEFQVVFLQAALQGRPVAIVPILCAAFESWTGDGLPRDVDAIEQVVSALRDVTQARPDVAVIAGVDFSHVGPRFGDPEPVTDALASRTSLHDRALLEAIVRGDADAFWRKGTARGNPQRVDALSAVYTALRILEPARGRLLRYGQAPDQAGGIVSFASLALSRESERA